MLTDLNRVDFLGVQEQASWVCGCDSETVTRLEESFKATLEQGASLETWASWLEQVVDNALSAQVSQQLFFAIIFLIIQRRQFTVELS